MKNYYILTIIANLFFSNLNAQVQDYLTIPNGTLVGLALNGNNLYIGDVNNAKIHKVDISQSTPTVTDFITTGINFPGLIEMSGNILYIPQITNLSSVVVNQTNPTLNTIAATNFTLGVALNGTDLYLSYRNEGKVAKFDLTQTNPTPTDVVTGLGGFLLGLALNGNDLYMARAGVSKISKIDITQTNPTIIDVLSGVTPIDLLLVGNDLYFSGDNAVKKIDITQTNPVASIIVNNLSSPVWGIEISNNFIYMAQQSENKILRFDLNTLGLANIDANNQIGLYPNPTNSTINIANNEKELDYKIIDLTSKVLLEGKTKKIIDISSLQSGIYLVQFENKQTFKIVKK